MNDAVEFGFGVGSGEPFPVLDELEEGVGKACHFWKRAWGEDDEGSVEGGGLFEGFVEGFEGFFLVLRGFGEEVGGCLGRFDAKDWEGRGVLSRVSCKEVF